MTTKCEFSRIEIPNDARYGVAAAKYVVEIARSIGFGTADLEAVELGVSEAVRAVIEYSFEPGEQATLELSCERVAEGLKVALKDKGLPFGKKLSTFAEKDTAADSTSIFANRIFQLKTYMDGVSLHNLGRAGKEIVLVKQLTAKSITDYYAECELEPYETSQPANTAAGRDSAYTVRRMKPSEAVEVSKSIFKTYGYSYAREYVYFPEKINALNASGRLYSAVVTVGDDEIAGHCALQYGEENPQIAEMVAGVVKPEYRSRGYFAKLTEYLVNSAQKNHTYSQRTGHQSGLRDCAIRLGLVPPTTIFKGFAEAIDCRLSILVQFRYLTAPSNLTLYLPSAHHAVVAAIYENLGVRAAISGTIAGHEPSAQSVFKIQVAAPLNFARIMVTTYGQNMVREIRTKLKELCLKKIEVINLYLNLSDPLTADMAENFEKLGFFFAGVMPGGIDGGDALILQYLNNVPIDYGQIKLASDIARRILAHIKRNDPNLA